MVGGHPPCHAEEPGQRAPGRREISHPAPRDREGLGGDVLGIGLPRGPPEGVGEDATVVGLEDGLEARVISVGRVCHARETSPQPLRFLGPDFTRRRSAVVSGVAAGRRQDRLLGAQARSTRTSVPGADSVDRKPTLYGYSTQT